MPRFELSISHFFLSLSFARWTQTRKDKPFEIFFLVFRDFFVQFLIHLLSRNEVPFVTFSADIIENIMSKFYLIIIPFSAFLFSLRFRFSSCINDLLLETDRNTFDFQKSINDRNFDQPRGLSVSRLVEKCVSLSFRSGEKKEEMRGDNAR